MGIRQVMALAIASAMGRTVMPIHAQRDIRHNRSQHPRLRGGSVRRVLVPNLAIEVAAHNKRIRRNSHRLSTWTGVRHDTVHVPSTVIKLEPVDHGRQVYR